MEKLKETIEIKMAGFMAETSKELMGNKSAGARARKLSMEIEKLLKEYRGKSTGRVEA